MPKQLLAGLGGRLGLLLLLLSLAPVAAAQTSPQPATTPPESGAVSPAAAPAPPMELKAEDTRNDGGKSIDLHWKPSADDGAGQKLVKSYVVMMSAAEGGPFAAHDTLDAGSSQASITGIPNGARFYFQVVAITAAGVGGPTGISGIASAAAKAQLWNSDRTNMFLVLLLYAGLFFLFLKLAKGGKNLFVRKIPGLAAMEEAIGRATEMGRPVLYVPGIQDMKDIQTICSMVILGDVAKITARYDTPLLVPCADPVVLSAAEERVRGGFADAGRPDAYDPNNVMYLSNEQFAYVAGITGIMNRQKPAAVIYMGSYYAESLMLAETGFASGAVQVAGTANVHQLPFFVVACDYTLIGEELYAASAYLSRDPELMGSLKASDATKLLIIAVLILGTVFLNVPATHDVGAAMAHWFVAR